MRLNWRAVVTSNTDPASLGLYIPTGVQINASSQILISKTVARAVFETPNAYYIPGVPYRGKIKLQDHYGNGMKNRKVYLVIRFMRRRFIKTYITDGSGIASFNLDTTSWNSSSVSLEGRFTLEDLIHTPWKTDFSYTNAYHHLQPFHVTTKSFLDIHPLTGTLPCGLKQNVQVTFTLSRDDLGEATSRIGFAYYVTGKAGIVVRGQRNIQVGKLNMLKGSFSIPLTFTADFTPSPSLVVYAIFPNGGVTADSIQFDVALCFENQKCSFPLSSNGSRNVPVAVPAASTDWKVKVFCLAGRGFGLAPTVSLRTGQPFFVDVMLPYSVKRGETFALKATVFNYLQQCIQVCACATGDLMGVALQNLDHLVQMPHGCGEQNMVLFAPIVYVLQYLDKTRQLTPEIKERATGFLRKGKLTAFVVKSFSQARKYIYVDDKNIQDALRWLEQNQLPSGCFATKGSLFHSSLKGKLVQTTLRCLQRAVHNITNIYTEAVLAYAFALAGDYETTQELLYKLEEQAIKSGGQIHWSPKPSSLAPRDVWPDAQSVDIELTSYVLLAYLSKPRVHAGDMTTAAGIVAWLTQQQNGYGGFASTQDTVVALQALAKYAARTFSTSGQALVRVKSQRGFEKSFQVTRQKRLLVQQAALTEVPGQLLVQVHGSSCVFTQTVLRYHEPPRRTAVTFTLRVNTELTNCSQANTRVFTVRILASYIGSRVTSNMAIVEVSLLSGFMLAPRSRMLLERKNIVKKVEVKADVVYIYLEKLNDESQTFLLQLEQVIQMKNLKPAIIKVYDYYQPEERALADYSAVCS
ncbi:alpha-2-macroglobulin-like protein 1 [Limosa lapponica baueri]|uniref:Alpha-2-macroglobulin-like protein 1 n=1 Tax=Limosa lapponica baueri TaxID=1758121 RepID=A0A2I0TDX6_LIMLA|nr:alpha-2-macroglobulin-like protein 1 [Limosa lapponica baueri]